MRESRRPTADAAPTATEAGPPAGDRTGLHAAGTAATRYLPSVEQPPTVDAPTGNALTPNTPAEARSQAAPATEGHGTATASRLDRLFDRVDPVLTRFEARTDAFAEALGRAVPGPVRDRLRPALDRVGDRIDAIAGKLMQAPAYEPPVHKLPDHLVVAPGTPRDERHAMYRQQLAEQRESPGLRDFAIMEFTRHCAEVPAGLCIVKDDFDNASTAASSPPDETRTSVFVHAYSDLVQCGGAVLDAHGFAEVLRAANLPSDRLLRLVACEAGKTDAENGGECFAQLLADELGRPVEAPTEVVWNSWGGDPIVSSVTLDPLTGNERATYPPDGAWKVFQPRGAQLR